MTTILNITQHNATEEQKAQGVIDLAGHRQMQLEKLLTFQSIPTCEEMQERAKEICLLIIREIETLRLGHQVDVMIDGAPYFMPYLERELLKTFGFGTGLVGVILYAFSERVSEEKTNPDGSVTKTNVFKHIGFVKGGEVFHLQKNNLKSSLDTLCKNHY